MDGPQLKAFQQMAELQEEQLSKITELPEDPSGDESEDSTPEEIKIEQIRQGNEDWPHQINMMTVDDDDAKIKTVKLSRPKYTESSGPLASWF